MSVNYYQYQACDAQGNITNGQLSAESEREAIAMLQARKLVLNQSTFNMLLLVSIYLKRF